MTPELILTIVSLILESVIVISTTFQTIFTFNYFRSNCCGNLVQFRNRDASSV